MGIVDDINGRADLTTHALYVVLSKEDYTRLLGIARAVEALEGTRRGRERRGATVGAYARVDRLARASFDGDLAALDTALASKETDQ